MAISFKNLLPKLKKICIDVQMNENADLYVSFIISFEFCDLIRYTIVHHTNTKGHFAAFEFRASLFWELNKNVWI